MGKKCCGFTIWSTSSFKHKEFHFSGLRDEERNMDEVKQVLQRKLFWGKFGIDDHDMKANWQSA